MISANPVSPTVLVLGTGPAGLVCADRLARAGVSVRAIESSEAIGGLMCGVAFGDFRVDLGRKELYSRLESVHQLWGGLLGSDYQAYEHRVGILHGRQILEMTAGPRGALRGLPWYELALCGLDVVRARIRSLGRAPRNHQEFWYARRGPRWSHYFSQGFDEKFRGVRWADLPVQGPQQPPEPRLPPDDALGWFHPRLGTGQLVGALAARIAAAGGEIHHRERVTSVQQEGTRIVRVHTEGDRGGHTYTPQHIVSTLPLEALGRLLEVEAPATATNDIAPRRGVVLVYLGFSMPARFPHVYLQVTCPALRAGRIVNYAAYGGGMVPAGQSCLCIEYFCVAPDPLLEASDAQMIDLALGECVRAGLVDPATCTDRLVLKIPGADPATTTRDWQTSARRHLTAAVAKVENLYDAKRPGIDLAAAAGLEVADRILAQGRESERSS